MKKITSILIMALFLHVSFAQEKGINFKKDSFESILALAKKENKLVFIDCFTVWCGPCKELVKTVFPQEEVGSFFNDNFISVAIDMEKGEGVELAQYYQIDSYPTLLFVNSNGDLVTRSSGLIAASTLLENAKIALDKK
ncbi:thioredoxin domain-containing protein [Cellulophaga sp. 20_2_10]|uniref:thioredoxin family protein n=1 Tax=Cellulophaga sp. 20_2_10 TaxID=2942476 RepID=UPI00201A3F28|nr:thioredoxin fold domain-containing protein [Cellulophaga sp. 20_2_10]MCL5247202.1 thioredoxin domain-containing protein [Cellulophaga sp. 20_2_10]